METTTGGTPMTLALARLNLGRILAYALSIGLMLLGFCILFAFTGPVYVEPSFQHSADILKGFGLLCLLGGGRIAVWLSPVITNRRDMRLLKMLLVIGMIVGIYLVASGVWGIFVS